MLNIWNDFKYQKVQRDSSCRPLSFIKCMEKASAHKTRRVSPVDHGPILPSFSSTHRHMAHGPSGILKGWLQKKCLFKRFGSENVWETNTTTQFTAPSNGSLYPFMTYGCSMSQRTLASVIWNISATARPKWSDRSMQAPCKWQHIFRIQFDFNNNYIPAPSSRGEMKTLPIPETLMS